jgi:AcrR family transcriptional regulator
MNEPFLVDKSKSLASNKTQSLNLIDNLSKGGMTIAEACKQIGITQPTYYRWRREASVKDGNVEPDSSTAQHILDTAEVLLADKGLKASLREISRAADVGVGTINYYFTSRNDLLYHITARGGDIFMDERFKLLKEAESKTGKQRLIEIITAYYLPALQAVVSRKKEISNYSRFLRRMIQSTDYEIQEIVHRCFSETHKQFISAFKRALPELTEKQIYLRYIALTGVYFSISQNPVRVNMITKGKLKLTDPKKDLAELMPILMGIMTGN